MKQLSILLTITICLISHSTKAMEKWPEYFQKLSCPGPDEEIHKEALLEANPFWKKVAEPKTNEKKNAYLREALNLPGGDPVWMYRRKAIVCTLAAGANPDIANICGTALTKAMDMDDYPLGKFALQCGANLNIKRNDEPVLFFAKSLKIVKLLVDHKADVFSRDSMENTVLHKASRKGSHSADLIPYYIQRGCEINALDKYFGETPLMHAASVDPPFNGTKFRLLLKSGADITIKPKHGKTVWDIAKQQGCLERAQKVYNQFQQECTAYGLLINRLRLFSKQS